LYEKKRENRELPFYPKTVKNKGSSRKF